MQLGLSEIKTDTWVNIYLSGATLMLTHRYAMNTVVSTCTLWGFVYSALPIITT